MIRFNQTTLTGEIDNNTTNKGLNGGIYNRITENYRVIFNMFFFDESETGLCRPFIEKKTRIHENSINRVFKKLLNEELIALIAQNVGPNKRRKYYKITEKGEEAWRQM